jgi:5-methylcytosine-specific restriction endonuclease McrA
LQNSKVKVMKKEFREKVYFKYDGKCAYCGNDVPYKDFQVDHIIPKESFNTYKYNLDYTVNDFRNSNPSCRRCNHYKRSYTLEDFRHLMKTLHERISKAYINKVAIDYGVIELRHFDGIFHFEK